MAITFDVAVFRQQFPAFDNEATYSDATLQTMFDAATCYISDDDYGRLNGNCRLRALNLMTAHLQSIQDSINAGEGSPDILVSASIGSTSVTVQPPENKDQWEWWLNQTPYGQQLLSLLLSTSVGGFYIGGLAERSAFRKFGGQF